MRLHILFLCCLITLPAFAEELVQHEIIPLTVSAESFSEMCASRSWSGTKIVWKGVRDARPERTLGVQTKKGGKEEVAVVTDQPLEKILDATFQQLFTACGLILTQKSSDDLTELSAEILDFRVTGEKKILTAKQKGTSKITYVVKKGPRESNIEISVEASEKNIRKTGTKQVQVVAERLLLDSLKEVPRQILFQLK